MAVTWQTLRNYPNRVEAEFDQERLQQAGIPVLLQGPEAGIFGGGFSGASPFGVELSVPDNRVEEARALIAPE